MDGTWLSHHYSPDTSVTRARVMSHSLLDGLLGVSLQPSIVNLDVFSIDDLRPATVVKVCGCKQKGRKEDKGTKWKGRNRESLPK